MNPWPGASTTLDGEALRIWEAWPLASEKGAGEPGTVVSVSTAQRQKLPPEAQQEALAVQTGEGLLVVLRLQRAGRRALPAGEFVRGLRDLFGRRLGRAE